VTGLIRAPATELGGSGITATAVSPGSTATGTLDESARLHNLPAAQAFAAQQPLGRLLEPAEVAAVLASRRTRQQRHDRCDRTGRWWTVAVNEVVVVSGI
jgi:NAD(P)-dependent dehydrogenase (short-subunit alcohol dehydrogenase family)